MQTENLIANIAFMLVSIKRIPYNRNSEKYDLHSLLYCIYKNGLAAYLQQKEGL